jgi:hypothetical protein
MTNKVFADLHFFITKHAQTRMQQRSFSEADIATIDQCGTVINDWEILLTNKDVERETSPIRNQIKSLQRRADKARVKLCGTRAKNITREMHADIATLRQQIANLERLRNCKIVVEGNRLVTCYNCSKSELKRISRIIN